LLEVFDEIEDEIMPILFTPPIDRQREAGSICWKTP
jgi:hypothetical protein